MDIPAPLSMSEKSGRAGLFCGILEKMSGPGHGQRLMR